MNKTLKTKWVKALRSGKIKQGKGALLDEKGSMCCVGVLGRICGISDKALLENASSLTGGLLEPLEVLGDRAWILAAMNDGTGRFADDPQTFKKIADYIEANL